MSTVFLKDSVDRKVLLTASGAVALDSACCCIHCPPVAWEDMSIVISGATDCGACIDLGVTGSDKYTGAAGINGTWAIDSSGFLIGLPAITIDRYTGHTCSGSFISTRSPTLQGKLECGSGSPKTVRLIIQAPSTSPPTVLFASGYYLLGASPLVMANNLSSIAGPCGNFGGEINMCLTGSASLSW